MVILAHALVAYRLLLGWSYISSDVLSIAHLLINPDIAITRKGILHARGLPGEEHGPVWLRSEVCPCHRLDLADYLACLRQIVDCLFKRDSLLDRELEGREEVQMW
jgi:hypothetical protein